MHKFLIAVDESKNSLNAVQCVATVARPDRVSVTLLHILDTPPDLEKQPTIHPIFKSKLQELRGQIGARLMMMEQVLAEYTRILVQEGVPPEHIQSRVQKAKYGAAWDIITEAKEGRYDTIVMGRRGISGMEKLLLGSISNKIVKTVKNCSVWIIDKQ